MITSEGAYEFVQIYCESFSTEKMVSFLQIFKKGQNIKRDIWKCECPIKVELVKNSSHRAGTLQMLFEIHANLCVLWLFISFNHSYTRILNDTNFYNNILKILLLYYDEYLGP